MAQSYLRITPKLSLSIRLIVADVDGTLIRSGESISPPVCQAVQSLERQGIMVGLASGRPLTRLDPIAQVLKISGPIIAENGAVAKLKRDSPLVSLGYSRQPALDTLKKLKNRFGNEIREAEDNGDRLVDVGFYYDGIDPKILKSYTDDVQLLDSGYMLHLLQQGVSKGETLIRILSKIGDGRISPGDVMVFGDSATDASLFELFKNSVLIVNPRLKKEQIEVVRGLVKYQSELSFEDGFTQVCSHIMDMRSARI